MAQSIDWHRALDEAFPFEDEEGSLDQFEETESPRIPEDFLSEPLELTLEKSKPEEAPVDLYPVEPASEEAPVDLYPVEPASEEAQILPMERPTASGAAQALEREFTELLRRDEEAPVTEAREEPPIRRSDVQQQVTRQVQQEMSRMAPALRPEKPQTLQSMYSLPSTRQGSLREGQGVS